MEIVRRFSAGWVPWFLPKGTLPHSLSLIGDLLSIRHAFYLTHLCQFDDVLHCFQLSFRDFGGDPYHQGPRSSKRHAENNQDRFGRLSGFHSSRVRRPAQGSRRFGAAAREVFRRKIGRIIQDGQGEGYPPSLRSVGFIPRTSLHPPGRPVDPPVNESVLSRLSDPGRGRTARVNGRIPALAVRGAGQLCRETR